MTCTGTIIRLNPGQDFSADAVMPDGAGGTADLTGFTASIADASDEMPGAVAVSIPDAANGLTRRTITWQAGWALTPRVLGQFRERHSSGSDKSLPQPMQP